MTMPNLHSDFTQKEINTFQYFDINKERLCIKADGSLGKYTKFQAFFVKLFSFINKISFDRQIIIDRITILKAQFELTVDKNLEDFTYKLSNDPNLQTKLANNNLENLYNQLDAFFGNTRIVPTVDSNFKLINDEVGNYIGRGVAF
jgi:hypothetical protein